MIDSKKIASNSTFVAVGQILNMLLNFLTMIMLARYLDQEQFGLFTFAVIFIGYFAILPDFGMKPVVIREMSKDESSSQLILTNAFLIKIVLSCITIVLCVFTAHLLGYSQTLIQIILIFSAMIFISGKLTSFRILLEAPFESRLEMKTPMLLRLMDSVIQFLCVAILIRLKSDLLTLAFYYMLGSAPGFLLNAAYFRRHVRWSLISKKMLVALTVESFPIALYVLFSRLFFSLEFLILKHHVAEQALGVYSAAYRLIAPLDFIPAAIIYSLYPLMSRTFVHDRDKLVRYFRFSLKILLLIGLSMSIYVTFHAAYILNLVYTQKYIQAANVLIIMGWTELLYFVIFLFVDFNNSAGRQKVNAQIAFGMLIMSIVLNLTLIPKYGITGAAMAKCMVIVTGLIAYYLKLAVRKDIQIVPLALKSIAVFLFLSILMYLVRSIPFLLNAGIFVIGIVSTVFIFRYFSREERETVLSLFKLKKP